MKLDSNYAKLRGHHLICLQFYKGEGYDDSFIENLEKVVKRAKNNGIIIVSGADDVCIKCPYLKKGECNYQEGAESEIRSLDSLALKLLSEEVGNIVKWNEISKKLPNIICEWYNKACKDCSWRSVCHIDERI